MKKKESMQKTTDRPGKVHGMYGSMHADMDLFEGTGIAGLRGMDLGFLTGFKNRRKDIRPNGKNRGTRRIRGTGTSAGAIAVERPVFVGGMSGFGRFGKGLGSGSANVRAGAVSAGFLRKPAGRTRTRVKEQESLLRALGRSFSIRGFLLLMLAALSISAALVLMLFNFKKAVITGNTKYSQKQIESFITQGKLGENTFVMALKYHNRTVKGIPFVDRIDVDILNPSTVRVNITEKPLDGYVVRGDDKIYFSKEGVVQTISGRTDENVTVVNGIELVNPQTDAQVQAKNQSGMDNVLTLLSAMERYDLKADSIDVDRLGSITVTFGDVRLTVGKTGYDMKMYKVHQIFPFFKGKSGCISMTGSDFRGDNIVLSPVESKADKHAESDSGKNGGGGGKHGESGEAEDSGAASEKAAAKNDSSEKDVSEKENSENSGNEKSEIEKQIQKEKAAGESAEADAQKKAEAAESSDNPAKKQTSEEPAQKPVEKEAAPAQGNQKNQEETAVPAAPKPDERKAESAEEKEAVKPEAAQEKAGGQAEKAAEPTGEKSPEKPVEPAEEEKEVKEAEEAEKKPAGQADTPASMEIDGQAALPASQKPMAPVAQKAAE